MPIYSIYAYEQPINSKSTMSLEAFTHKITMKMVIKAK